jgi:MipA family protein
MVDAPVARIEAPAAEPTRPWSAALGVVAIAGPEFAGAARSRVRFEPGVALRWGRVSLASRSDFAVRDGDPGARGGLRVELVRSDRWRSSLGLRWDRGRDESESADLRGLGDVRATLRARLALGYRFDGGWRADASASVDALGRGGGWLGSAGVGRDLPLSERTGINTSLTLNFAGSRSQQNNFGVTPAQAAASGYAVYTPGAGLRDIALGIGGRTQLDPRWAVFYGAGVSRLLGPSAASPLVRDRTGWSLRAGVAMRI